MKDAEALYLFCFAMPGVDAVLKSASPNDDLELLVLDHGDVAAVYEMVSLEEFTGPGSEERMSDIEWVGPKVVRHESAIQTIMRFSPVLPIRFGTLLTGKDSLRALLKRNAATIRQFLSRVDGRTEWAVKGFLDRKLAMARMASRPEPEVPGSSGNPGTQYLFSRSKQNSAETRLDQMVRDTCEELWRELVGDSEDQRELKVLPGAGSESGDMIVNWAFLVDAAEADSIKAHVDSAGSRLADQGVRFTWSGPWAPYSFTPTLETESEP